MKKFKFILIIFILILAIGLFYFFFINKNDNINTPKIEHSIEKYNYNLYDNSTKEYKKLFQELSAELSKDEIDEKKYVELISKMFIIDFYTLDNKLTNLNIGGVEFVHKDIVDNFKLKANETLYKYLENNMYGDRNQKLPVVKEVTINNISQKEFKYNNNADYKAFFVDASWTYEKDLGYENKKTLIFVHEDNKLSLVEMS